ncbi:hypothetical protein MB46_06440 [Arthrobacter alpinus]|uniref:hypothetical protein n=1 Tax=Arthrobacter alpinus TaxID=656366 RepID=UPI0006792E69|nr:hypothetical protein [Arthrobacter alpinus]ALV45198.1 hypothetical protein MB46_06440 [Arthrobacter alpinus]
MKFPTRRAVLAVLAAAAALQIGVGGQLGGAGAAIASPGSPQAYYVDCSATASGTGAQSSPFNSLTQASALTMGPGDRLLFKKGTTCVGTFKPQGSGSSTAPVVIGAYGSSTAKAVIDGNGGATAIHLFNQQYITLTDLEVTNAANPGSNRRGITVELADFGTGNGYVLSNLYVHDVWGDDTKGPTGSQGIAFMVTGDTVPTTFNDVRVTHNTLANIDRQALVLQLSTWSCRVELACTATPNWLPARNVVVSDNSLSNIGGDGIVLNTTENAVAQNNVIKGFNVRSKAYNAGLWSFNSNGFLAQFNDVSGGKGHLDGMAYDSDGGNVNATFQYNLSYNNEGGFFLFCPYGNNINEGTIVRYNISQNDSYRGIENCDGTVTGAQVYNNTIYIGAGVSQVVVNENTSKVRDVKMYNNIIYKGGSGTASFHLTANTAYTFANNTVSSWITQSPANPGGTTANPLMCNAGNASSLATATGYRLQAASAAIHTGTPVPNNGGRDYFGSIISNPPTIGASESIGC